jgi:hypothetical protein
MERSYLDEILPGQWIGISPNIFIKDKKRGNVPVLN